MPTHDDRPRRAYHLTIAVVLVTVIAIDCAIIAYRLLQSTPIDISNEHVRDYPLRLDPDVASADALAAIPGLSTRQARGIVAYREHHQEQDNNGRCYQTLADLDRVKWIGPKTLEKIAGYVHFPAPAAQRGTPSP